MAVLSAGFLSGPPKIIDSYVTSLNDDEALSKALPAVRRGTEKLYPRHRL